MFYKVIIPARYNSSRLPGKLLLDLGGKPILSHVIENAKKSNADEVLVATDDLRIAEVAKKHNIDVCMTSSSHNSGTDRIAEVVSQQMYPDETIIVNVQGDEPFLPFQLIDQVATDLAQHPSADVSTLSSEINNDKNLFDPHVVKVVCNAKNYALYFSRAPIPWDRENFPDKKDNLSKIYHRHIGLYAYRSQFLSNYIQFSPCSLEKIECLEQLRILYYGGSIHVTPAIITHAPGIDTFSDLERAKESLKHLFF
ncbi:3-deoxy-manno-octulosonate cytidylyltransferase [Candidatus Nitrosacidococcus tergens]|uniref:3-deoxy-manno-octulosonate cytidylyltransferase n=1 Tax=Candidatus Nitrosacidococcus tergens TaxID=553981 RepID=A0A7G1QAS9_9GAMM|nr:3-deoxy-manno-octulosonate cytidylyltransferase [Candidatus Nitrosacidococcus tergens]CAB1276890.1 3-deoxy-manno-octulosonate cytidylyltransferase [Candidatus Nitrosacidococcus tergens]